MPHYTTLQSPVCNHCFRGPLDPAPEDALLDDCPDCGEVVALDVEMDVKPRVREYARAAAKELGADASFVALTDAVWEKLRNPPFSADLEDLICREVSKVAA